MQDLRGVSRIKEDEDEEEEDENENVYREERRETWQVCQEGARAALRFRIRAGRNRKEGKEGGGYLQSQV